MQFMLFIIKFVIYLNLLEVFIMVKKIRFPLEMDNGIEVRGMEELRDNFSLTRIVHYFENGKLLTWLKDRYEDELARKVEILDRSDKQFAQKISNIFGVPYNESEEDALEEELVRAKRLELLKKYTDDTSFMEKVNQIAFEQDELYDLLDENITTIYLCGEKFSIPLSKKGIKYIGVNSPIIVVDSLEYINWEEKGIELEGIRFNEKYQGIVNEYENKCKNTNECEDTVDEPSIDFEKIKKLYDEVSNEISFSLSIPSYHFNSHSMCELGITSRRDAEKIVSSAVDKDVAFLEKIFVRRSTSSFDDLRMLYFNDLNKLCALYSEVFSDASINIDQIESQFSSDYNKLLDICEQMYYEADFPNIIDYSMDEYSSTRGLFASKIYMVSTKGDITGEYYRLKSRCETEIKRWYNKFKKEAFKRVESEFLKMGS